MWQGTEPIELPLKALRLESLTLLRDLLLAGPALDRQNQENTSLQARQTATKSDCNCPEEVKCQDDRQNPQLLRA